MRFISNRQPTSSTALQSKCPRVWPLVARFVVVVVVLLVSFLWHVRVPAAPPGSRTAASSATPPPPDRGDHFRCPRLVLLLHVHKAGGTSVLNFVRDAGFRGIGAADAQSQPPLVRLLSSSSPSYGVYGTDCDQLALTSTGGGAPTDAACVPASRPPPAPEPPLELGDAGLWRGIHAAGADYVAFEHNFLPPSVFVDRSKTLRSVAASVALLREPWARFRSTYERELYLKCRQHPDRTACFEANTLKEWIRTGYDPNDKFPGVLSPNYMVRMLNGLADQPQLELTRAHLKKAKAALKKFDLVLYLEMPEEERMAALRAFLSTDTENYLAHVSNNKLKKDPNYEEIIATNELMIPTFQELNKLDIELYAFTKVLVEQRRQEGAVRC